MTVLLAAFCVAAGAASPPLDNLAAKAKISASSERTSQKLLAKAVADGRVAPKGTGIYEMYPPSAPHARSWAVNGEEAQGKAELVFEWDTPVQADQIVYYGRTAWAMECFKDYEVYLNDAAAPVVKGTLKATSDPQRIRFSKTEVNKVTIKFLSSYDGPNPGATEILVLGEEVSDEVLAKFGSANPPHGNLPWDRFPQYNVVWNTPSKDAADAMPIGNGSVVANVWVDPGGHVLIDIGKINDDGGKVLPVGRVRVKLTPGLSVAKGALRQTLMFGLGAVDIFSGERTKDPGFAVWVDANNPAVHVQLTGKPAVGVEVALDGRDDATSVPPAKDNHVFWRRGSVGAVMLAEGMVVKPGQEPGAAPTLVSARPTASLDFQIHVVSAEAPTAGAWVEQAEKAVAAARKGNPDSVVHAHMNAWKEFWRHNSIFIGGSKDAEMISRALILTRWFSACSGRGIYPLKPQPPAKPEETEAKSAARWSEKQIGEALDKATKAAGDYFKAHDSSARFTRFWGAEFERLGEKTQSDPLTATLQEMLIQPAGGKIHLLPGWPENLDVSFRIALPGKTRIEAVYQDGNFREIEVWPKMRTGTVVGAGPLEKKARRALQGPFRMPALISFISPSWVKSRTGNDGFAVTMKDAHFNGLEGGIMDIEFCKKHGFYLLLHGVTPLLAHELKDERTVISYFMADRNKPGSFPVFGQIRKSYEEIDPNHPTEFNTYAKWGAIEYFVDVVRPRMLEYYDYHWKRGPHLQYHYLEYYRRMSIAAGGIPVFRYVHVHDDPPVKMRQTVSMSVAYGLKGFKWWVGWTMFDIHKVKEKQPPPLSGIGKEVKQINTMLKVFSPYLAPARSVAVYHTAPLPTSTRQAPADYWAQPSGEHVVMGVFKNDDDDGNYGGDYIVLANRDIGKAHEATLTFLPADVSAVEKIDKRAQQWNALPPAKQGERRAVKLIVQPGDVELLRVTRGEPR